MTPDEMKAAAQVMIDAANGKKVQVRQRIPAVGEWGTEGRGTQMGWDWRHNEYRVAPEPFRGWVIKPKPDEIRTTIVYLSHQHAVTSRDQFHPGCEIFEVVEVIEKGEA